MNIDFTLRQLRYFLVVAEELNFTRAAERLQIAQPPLSRQIQSLEHALGFKLLDRTNRRVELTAAGELFSVECRQTLSQLERNIQAAQQIAQGKAGQLILGFEGAAHNELIIELMHRFRQQMPNIELVMQEMSSGKQVLALEQGELDAGLIEPIAAKEHVNIAPLLSDPFVVVLPENHPLATKEQLELNQLADESWVTGRSNYGCGLLLRIFDACRQSGFTPKVQQETNDLQMTLSLVESGLGITLIPRSSQLKQPGITYRPLKSPAPEVQVAIAWQQNRRSPTLNSFFQVLESYLGIELQVR